MASSNALGAFTPGGKGHRRRVGLHCFDQFLLQCVVSPAVLDDIQGAVMLAIIDQALDEFLVFGHKEKGRDQASEYHRARE